MGNRRKLKRLCILFKLSVTVILFTVASCSSPKTQSAEPVFGLAIHGGAGTILKENISPEMEKAYRDKLTEALMTGYNMLRADSSGLDAVEAAINILEDSPLFNAGKGAVFTNAGTNELDASIMDGATLQAGAVAGVKHIKNPISLARLVMEKSPHVMLAGDGAEIFARENGINMVPQDYFYTERRWDQLLRKKSREEKEDESSGASPEQKSSSRAAFDKFGTVGVVALDKGGNLAAGTSTGGMTNKKFGRIGDSPVIGAGTYANNQTCAVSATGHGEYFIRLSVAHDISALMAYKKLSLSEAANQVIMEKLTKLGGTGGVISMDKQGNIAMPFNTPGMYRGYVDKDGNAVVKIYKD